MHQLSDAAPSTIAITPANGVAGTSDISGVTLDMANFVGVLMTVFFGVITSGAATTIKAQQGDESDLSDAADLEGTAQTVADDDDNEVKQIDLTHVQKRYCRIVVTRSTQNAVVASALYQQYRGRKMPVTQGTGVTVETHDAPDEGTA